MARFHAVSYSVANIYSVMFKVLYINALLLKFYVTILLLLVLLMINYECNKCSHEMSKFVKCWEEGKQTLLSEVCHVHAV
jgi:hypothetical protein